MYIYCSCIFSDKWNFMHTTSISIPRLYDIRNSYGTQMRNEKQEIISFLTGQARLSKKLFKQYIEVLLFIKAFPDDETMLQVADNELERLTGLLQFNTKLADSLYDSGIKNTQNRGMFSFKLTKWLRATYGQYVQPDLSATDQKKCIAVLTCIMGEVPTEILQEGYMKWEQWLIAFKVDKDHDLLDVLIRCFEAAPVPPRIKDELWNDMGIVVSVMPGDKMPWPGSNVDIQRPYYYHSAINKNARIADVLKQRPREVQIDDTQKNDLITLTKMVLASHQRETDPVTHAEPKYTRYYDQGSGLTTVLMGLPPERRQPIDSYIGYMAFKNGVPIAYGGGWILFDSCRIGVNVFPAFRGGESSFIFAQIIGLYKHLFRLNRFTVDPYQIGKNNSEGIRSGAFWMYYRLGFKPVQEHLRELADSEYEKISTQKPYRSPASILNKLADSKLELFTGTRKNAVQIDATDLSALSLAILHNKYGGNMERQNKAMVLHAARVKNVIERRFVDNWLKILGPEQWEGSLNKSDMRELLRLKSAGDEWAYVQLLQKQKGLRDMLMG